MLQCLGRLNALARISRPFTCIGSCLAVLAAGSYTAGFITSSLVVAGVAAGLLAGAGNIFNDVLDLPTDRINNPSRVLPTGQLSAQMALTVAAVSGTIALLLAAFVGFRVFLIALGVAILLVVYSTHLKSTVLLGNFVVGGLGGLLLVYGGMASASGSVSELFPLSTVPTLAVFAREVLKTIADYEGDKAVGLSTVATVWGTDRAKTFYKILVVLSLATTVSAPSFVILKPAYLVVVLSTVVPLSIVSLRLPAGGNQGLRFNLALQKIAFLAWLVAVLVA